MRARSVALQLIAATIVLAFQTPAEAQLCTTVLCPETRHQQLPDGTYRIFVRVENHSFEYNDIINVQLPGRSQFEIPEGAPNFDFVVAGPGTYPFSVQVCETGFLGIPESSCSRWEVHSYSFEAVAAAPPPPPQPIPVPSGVGARDGVLTLDRGGAAVVGNIPGLAPAPLAIPNTPPTLGGPIAPAPEQNVQPAAPLIPDSEFSRPPAPGPGINFAGTWDARTASGPFQMTLTQDGAGNVSGSYTVGGGEIIGGAVIGNQLFAQWLQSGGLLGNVVFTMAPDGSNFGGRFGMGFDPVDPNNNDQFWNGTRIAAAPPTQPTPPVVITIPIPIPTAPPAGQATGTAIVATDSNVRAGPSRETRSLGTARGGTTVPVVGCGQGWCAVSVPGIGSGYIAETLLRFGGPAPGLAPGGTPTPPPGGGLAAAPPPGFAPPVAAAPSYTGSWDTHTGNGGQFAVVLNQSGNNVTGSYQPYNGTMVGQVDGSGRLIYRWRQDGGYTGMGVFQISPDGRTLSGSFGSTDNPFENTYSWFATRN